MVGTLTTNNCINVACAASTAMLSNARGVNKMEKRVKTTCALDCPDNCGMIAIVKDGRLIRLKADREHKHTGSLLCVVGYNMKNRVYHPQRILYPQKRVEGEWKRITWDEALDTIADKIRFFQEKYGSGSIMHWQRTASWGASKQLVKRFFNLLGGVTTTKGSLCSGAARAAQSADMGTRLGNDPQEFLNSKVIIVWGRDPFKSCIHYVTLLKRAQRQGNKVITIDPIRTKTAKASNEHIAPRPGSDGYLAIGMAKQLLELGLADTEFINNYSNGYDEYMSLLQSFSMDEIVEKCGIKVETIRKLAEIYGSQKPAAIFLGYGINKWEHSVEMIRLIDALGAITGNIGKSGGGVNHGFITGRHFDKQVLAPEAAHFHRQISEPLLAQGILESDNPPIKMLWVNASNPVISCPNSNKVIQALKSLDFLVVVDYFMTDTADLADIFLPTTTSLEEEDIVISWGHNWISPINKAIEPRGECKSDFQIVQELAERLGFGEAMRGTTREWLKKLLRPMEEKAGLTVEQVLQGPVRCPIAPMVAFEDRKFLTSSGKFEFIRDFYQEREGEYPYFFLPIMSNHWVGSVLLEEQHPKMVKVLINPKLAKERAIRNKSKVLVKSAVGQLACEAEISKDVPDNTCVIPHGTWIKRGGGEGRLIKDLQTTMGNMAAFNSTTVSIESLPAA